MAPKQRICNLFREHGRCKFGDKCRFSHDVSEANLAQQAPKPSTDASDFRSWSRLVRQNNKLRQIQPLGPALITFLKDALRFVQQDAGTRQEVITELATEDGLRRVSELETLIAKSHGCTATLCRRLFAEYLAPFLQILANDEINASLILENHVYKLLNYLFGPGGRRAVLLFTFAARALTLEIEDNNTTNMVIVTSNLEACIITLWKTINLSGSAPIMDEFHVIVEHIDNAMHCAGVHEQNRAFSRSKSFLDKIKRRLAVGTAIPEAVEDAVVVGAKAVFELSRDAPGWLSTEGPRHDNDFEDIKEIRIMPTAQEIHSPRLEYLPTTNPFLNHIVGVPGLLDRHFRLLREDTIGQLRDAVKVEFEKRNRPDRAELELQHKKRDMRTFTYLDARLADIRVHMTRGMELVYEFAQPRPLEGKSESERAQWWESSRRLQSGALVCLLDSTGQPVFCSVSENGLENNFGQGSKWQKKEKQGQKGINVYEDPKRAFIVLSLVETTEFSVDTVLSGFNGTKTRGIEVIVEFPGVLLPSFLPTLHALQRMSKNGDMPFVKIIAPSTREEAQTRTISFPEYSASRGFRFDLDCLVGGKPLSLSVNENFDYDTLLKNSTLDEKQAKALVNALCRNVALIQGPPGTGKSYTGIAIIKVLLANAAKAHLGPIICVCYTNHALDQLLEHLVHHGVDHVVRIGSRSKSQILEDVNLRAVTTRMEKTKAEKRTIWELGTLLERNVEEINQLLAQFSQAWLTPSVQAFLETHYPAHAAELFRQRAVDEEGFEVVHHDTRDPLHKWLYTLDTRSGVPPRPSRPLSTLRTSALGSMTAQERHLLYESWINEQRGTIKDKLFPLVEDYVEKRVSFDTSRQEIDLRCLKAAKVIGLTTSGLAKITHLLGRLGSKVLVCEEAGEVLEAHALTTLLPSIEHANLIGDHLQLRPQIQNYNLSSENARGAQFSLDMSLFERLVKPPPMTDMVASLPLSTLDIQRRMHPSISALIQSTLYPDLKDSPEVASYPLVAGMRKRLFWLDHRHPEGSPEADTTMSTSHSNDYEVSITVALINHLVRQGEYGSEDIAVLTPYLGQLRKLRKALSQTFAVTVSERDLLELDKESVETDVTNSSTARTTLLKAVRVATVDNFQGEEAKVVVISLVRSNDLKKCGFLRTENRINVALSRAQHGMYIIGNAETSGQVEMWAKVLKMLSEDHNIGNSLELCCPRHPETPIEVQTADDFTLLAPEGGCQLKCDQRLPCGHACINQCHAEHLHNAVYCLSDCSKPINGCQEHPCPKVCGDPCPERCKVLIKDNELPCGHIRDLPCYATKDLTSVQCTQLVPFTVQACGHGIMVKCHETISPSTVKCTTECGSPLPCGHRCPRSCVVCKIVENDTITVEDHGECQQLCGRDYSTCNHSCSFPCHNGTPCGLCQAPCDVGCNHSKCKKKCFEPCTPCAEPVCASACPHHKCDMPCAVPCNWTPCSKRCAKLLACGHQCPSVCGEQCPAVEFCQVCCTLEQKQSQVDFITMLTYEEIDLNEDPCIFPHCGHIVTLSNMDGHLGMATHYEVANGIPTAVKAGSEPFSSKDMKRCPLCRGSLREIARYGRIVRRALLDESTKRLHVWALKENVSLEQRVQEMEDRFNKTSITIPLMGRMVLKGSRNSQLNFIRNIKGLAELFKTEFILRKDLNKYLTNTRREEQPYYKVWSMVENIRKRRGVTLDNIPDDIQTVQLSYSVGATVMALKWDLLIISKILSMKRATEGLAVGTSDNEIQADLSTYRKECDFLVKTADSATLPGRAAEGHVLFARFVALEISTSMQTLDVTTVGSRDSSSVTREEPTEKLRQQGLERLEVARSICRIHTRITPGIMEEIDQVEKMLLDTFYTAVTPEERRSVVTAMAREFSGSGHWYYCAQGHPFTIGECGMPMQEARCPQCGSPVGGRNHVPVEGVRRADDLDIVLGQLRI